MAKSLLEKCEKRLFEAEGNAKFWARQVEFLTAQVARLRLEAEQLPPPKPKKTRKPLELPIHVKDGVSLIEQETVPRAIRGRDYETEGKVIARRDKKIVIWFKGNTSWAGIGRQEYHAGALVAYEIERHPEYKHITEAKETPLKGHFEISKMKDAISENDATIKEFLGIDFSINDVYKPKTTILIEE